VIRHDLLHGLKKVLLYLYVIWNQLENLFQMWMHNLENTNRFIVSPKDIWKIFQDTKSQFGNYLDIRVITLQMLMILNFESSSCFTFPRSLFDLKLTTSWNLDSKPVMDFLFHVFPFSRHCKGFKTGSWFVNINEIVLDHEFNLLRNVISTTVSYTRLTSFLLKKQITPFNLPK